jgi:hypothetical protein
MRNTQLHSGSALAGSRSVTRHAGHGHGARPAAPPRLLLASALLLGSGATVAGLVVFAPMPALAVAAITVAADQPAAVSAMAEVAAEGVGEPMAIHRVLVVAETQDEVPVAEPDPTAAEPQPDQDWRALVHQVHVGADTAERTDALLRAARFESAQDACVALAMANIHDEDPSWRVAALTVLRDADPHRFTAEFVTAMRDRDPSVQIVALCALSKCNDWQRLPPHVRGELIAQAQQVRDKLELRTYREMFAWVKDVWFEQALTTAGERLATS